MQGAALPNVKLLIGSLHWMRRIRNSSAHNERIYSLFYSTEGNPRTGRIKERYLKALRPSYTQQESGQKIIDLIVYFKYYLPHDEYCILIESLYEQLLSLKGSIHKNAFADIRGKMGIKDIDDLIVLKEVEKPDIDYDSFDKTGLVKDS